MNITIVFGIQRRKYKLKHQRDQQQEEVYEDEEQLLILMLYDVRKDLCDISYQDASHHSYCTLEYAVLMIHWPLMEPVYVYQKLQDHRLGNSSMVLASLYPKFGFDSMLH